MQATAPATEDLSPQQSFINHLFKRDAGERAELRRCLSADPPSSHLPAYRLVETHSSVRGAGKWRRDCFYMVAGLFALVERRPPARRGHADEGDRSGSTSRPLTVARAVKAYEGRSEKGEGNMSSTERRFLALLDSDRDQLPYRLRQMLQMVTRGQNAVSAPLDWAQLLRDLQYWREDEDDRVRQRWAQQFYEPSNDPNENQTTEESQS